MLVKQYMTRHPIMIEPHRRVVDVRRIMVENRVRHLPVIGDGKRLLGLVTRQCLQITPERWSSLDVWEITDRLSDLTAEKVMIKSPDLKTIGPDATLEDAAAQMTHHKISSLPVIESGDIVVGMITETDLLMEFQKLFGAYDPGWRLSVRMPGRRGEFGKLYQAIIDKGLGVMAMGSNRTPKAENCWDVMVKVTAREPGALQREDLEALVAGLEGQEIIDLRQTVMSES
jgi:acetoin utilization protein AcuB